eukprot:gene13393-13509_t
MRFGGLIAGRLALARTGIAAARDVTTLTASGNQHGRFESGDIYLLEPGNSPLFILVVNLVVIAIGLTMAFASGRAIAKTWRPFSNLPAYILILSAAERFLHYALAGQTLLSLPFYLVTFVLLFIAGGLGYRRMRVLQMVTQYSWLYQPAGKLSWKSKA